MNTGILIALGAGVAVALGWRATRKSDANDKTAEPTPTPQPEPETTAQPEPEPETLAAPDAEPEAPVSTPSSSEKPTLVMTPTEAQEAATQALGSTEPTTAPEEKTETPEAPSAEPTPVTESTSNDVPAGGNAVLVLLDVEGDQLSSPNRATLNAAQQIASKRGAELHVCCLGADTNSANSAGVDGATAVHTITDASLGDGVSESFLAAAVAALQAVPADVVVGPASTAGKGFLPRLAEHLGCGMITEILSVESADTFTRALWAGSAIATVQGQGRLVISVRATGFDPVATQAAQPQAIAFSAPQTRLRFVGRQATESARPDLSEAAVVVSGGRGTKGDFAPIEQLADALGAAMGASRAACDAGWVPNDLQVGQTGKVVAPDLYIAAGISGAIQHIAGMKGSKTIVAINKDEEAPIFSVADYGLVADLFDVCPELADKLSSQGLKPSA